MSASIQYVTNEQGERIAVLLDLVTYRQLISQPSHDSELLTGLDSAALHTLAESVLAPAAQERLDELLNSNAQRRLTAGEGIELDQLLEQIDQLTILKTRARYTLHRASNPL
jgi:hypothetical protein